MRKWADVKGLPGYTVCTDGRIYHGMREIRNRSMTANGYLKVDLGKRFDYVHRIVAEAFVENPFGYNEVNHIDGDKRNNRAENLEWVTHAENMRHARKERLISPRQGYRHPVEYIGSFGETIRYSLIVAGARDKGVAASSIQQALKRGSICAGGHWRDAR